jgi:hypothetical protein
LKIIHYLAQIGTFSTEGSATTVSMSDDTDAPPQRIIKRTLTITTTETWIVTLGPSTEAADRPAVSDTSQDIIDQAIDQISEGDQEDQS